MLSTSSRHNTCPPISGLCCGQARHNTCPPRSGLTMLSTSETQHVFANQRSNYAVDQRDTTRVRQSAV
ncbi:hypothetical protein DPMN_048431 [Dreissena polymorpha]|uniref:Uncharacterized protein n=1 Tax=Dreissena polymorpha TaxID=45954 RepID=A0A9D4D9L2_DREPO|nr:hypothetical protein DPMN_048431 [Dreissena polymorpha]